MAPAQPDTSELPTVRVAPFASDRHPSFTEAGAILTVDLAAIRANYRLLADKAAPAECAAVVKAHAYGLAEGVAYALRQEGCRTFFVAHVAEGRALRAVLPDARIFILNGVPPGAEGICVQDALIPVLNSMEQIEGWKTEGSRPQRRLPAALQVDSGMARLGLPPRDVERIAQNPGLLVGLELVLVMSHFACAMSRKVRPMPRNLPSSSGCARCCRGRRRHSPIHPACFWAARRITMSCGQAALYGINPTPGPRQPDAARGQTRGQGCADAPNRCRRRRRLRPSLRSLAGDDARDDCTRLRRRLAPARDIGRLRRRRRAALRRPRVDGFDHPRRLGAAQGTVAAWRPDRTHRSSPERRRRRSAGRNDRLRDPHQSRGRFHRTTRTTRHEGPGARQRRHRCHDRLLPGEGRPFGDGDRAPFGPRTGNELRQCGRGVARLCLALGGTGYPGQGDQVADDAARASGRASQARCRHVALARDDARKLHSRALRRQQGAHGADRRIQPRLPQGAARRYRHRL